MRFLALLGLTVSYVAMALPEARLGTHTERAVLPQILNASVPLAQLQETLSRTLVPELDALWDSRTDMPMPDCQPTEPCAVLTRLDGAHQGHPLVIFPGFTGYRKMYIETAYDLLQAGYGPVYIVDFRGQGEGQGSLPQLSDFVAEQNRDVRTNYAAALRTVAGPRAETLGARLAGLPIGTGHIREFADYVGDVNFAVSTAVAQNPGAKVQLHAHSTGALSLMLALGQNPGDIPWINRVQRVFLETPFLRNYQSDNLLKGWAPVTETFARLAPTFTGHRNPVYADRSIPEFVSKATGHFSPDNRISHSENRLSLSDGIRTWNGYETAGATWGWVRASVRAHYDAINPNARVTELNQRLRRIGLNFSQNGISLVAVTTDVDAFAHSPSTVAVMTELAQYGVEAHRCNYADAKHGLHQESDSYRNPFMRLWSDQKDLIVRRNYARRGEAPLACAPLINRVN